MTLQCKNCFMQGHKRKECPKSFHDFKSALENERYKVDKAFEWLHEIGFGPGCMITGMAREKKLCELQWSFKRLKTGHKYCTTTFIRNFEEVPFGERSVLTEFFEKLVYDTTKNWYEIEGVSSELIDIGSIYLPYHPVYAPTPTSKRVEILVKAAPEDIDKLKHFIMVYNHPVMKYNDAESYYAANKCYPLKIHKKMVNNYS